MQSAGSKIALRSTFMGIWKLHYADIEKLKNERIENTAIGWFP
jgi:hypothetical protein